MSGPIELRKLFSNIGSKISSVRLRSISSIHQKLFLIETITIEDLVQESELLRNLLEWFNWDARTEENDAMCIDLLSAIAKTPHGHENLNALKAADFLEAVSRDHANGLSRAHRERLLEVVVLLQSLRPAESAALPPVLPDAPAPIAPGTPLPSSPAEVVHYVVSPAPGSVPRTRIQIDGYPHTVRSPTAARSPGAPGLATAVRRRVATAVAFSADDTLASDFRFPSVSLNTVDEDYMFSLGVRLRMSEEAPVATACHEIASTAARNFPPEVFLQRPDVLRHLFALLQEDAMCGQALAALTSLYEGVAEAFAKCSLPELVPVAPRTLSLHVGELSLTQACHYATLHAIRVAGFSPHASGAFDLLETVRAFLLDPRQPLADEGHTTMRFRAYLQLVSDTCVDVLRTAAAPDTNETVFCLKAYAERLLDMWPEEKRAGLLSRGFVRSLSVSDSLVRTVLECLHVVCESDVRAEQLGALRRVRLCVAGSPSLKHTLVRTDAFVAALHKILGVAPVTAEDDCLAEAALELASTALMQSDAHTTEFPHRLVVLLLHPLLAVLTIAFEGPDADPWLRPLNVGVLRERQRLRVAILRTVLAVVRAHERCGAELLRKSDLVWTLATQYCVPEVHDAEVRLLSLDILGALFGIDRWPKYVVGPSQLLKTLLKCIPTEPDPTSYRCAALAAASARAIGAVGAGVAVDRGVLEPLSERPWHALILHRAVAVRATAFRVVAGVVLPLHGKALLADAVDRIAAAAAAINDSISTVSAAPAVALGAADNLLFAAVAAAYDAAEAQIVRAAALSAVTAATALLPDAAASFLVHSDVLRRLREITDFEAATPTLLLQAVRLIQAVLQTGNEAVVGVLSQTELLTVLISLLPTSRYRTRHSEAEAVSTRLGAALLLAELTRLTAHIRAHLVTAADLIGVYLSVLLDTARVADRGRTSAALDDLTRAALAYLKLLAGDSIENRRQMVVRQALARLEECIGDGRSMGVRSNAAALLSVLLSDPDGWTGAALDDSPSQHGRTLTRGVWQLAEDLRKGAVSGRGGELGREGLLAGRKASLNAFKNIVAFSLLAKRFVLQVGIVESLSKYLNEAHALYASDATGVQSQIYTELLLLLEAVINVLADSEETKTACVSSRLPAVLSRLLSACEPLGHGEMLQRVLAALCSLGPLDAGDPAVRKTCLARCLALVRARTTDAETFGAAFAFLGVTALSGTGRILLGRSNILVDCVGFVDQGVRLKDVRRLDATLRFLGSLSLYSEGQSVIVKTKGLFEALFGAVSAVQRDESRMLALAVLRNVAFNQEGKLKFLSNSEFVSAAIEVMKTAGLAARAMALSLLWTLAAANYKLRAAVKQPAHLSAIAAVYHPLVAEYRRRTGADPFRPLAELRDRHRLLTQIGMLPAAAAPWDAADDEEEFPELDGEGSEPAATAAPYSPRSSDSSAASETDRGHDAAPSAIPAPAGHAGVNEFLQLAVESSVMLMFVLGQSLTEEETVVHV